MPSPEDGGPSDTRHATGCSESTVRRRLDSLRRNELLYFDPLLIGYASETILC